MYARDQKKWDYCRPIIDYDKVREKNQYELNVITVEARKVNAELIDLIKQSEFAMKELKGIRDGHAELDKQILLMTRATKATEYNLGNLYALEVKWKNAEDRAIAIGKLIEKAEAEKRKNELKKAKEKKIYYPTDKLTMEVQEREKNRKLNPKVTRREKVDITKCKGMDGYESEKPGGGLNGEYFDNEAWIGKGKIRLDNKLKFNWKGTSPIGGVNLYNFSVRWTGFIKAPLSGRFKFKVETGDSVMITLNDKVIIAHNMKTAVTESITRANVWLNWEIYLVQHPKVDRSLAYSNEIYLIGGNKYK